METDSPDPTTLFTPLCIGGLTVAGRVMKSATSETRATPDGFVTDELLAFYEPIFRAGTPLVVTGNLYVSLAGRPTTRMAGVDADDKIPGLRRWAELARRHGSALFGQLNHCGRQVLGAADPVGASAVREKLLGTRPRPLREDEIRGVIGDFAAAAARCQEAGFAGVQIHCGHGYLLSQFLTPYTNRRRDAYGGSLAGRTRLAALVLRACRERVGAGFPIIAKLNGADALWGRRGLATAELVEVARILERDGLDGVEITCGHYESGFPMIRGQFGPFFKAMLKDGVGRELTPWKRAALSIARPALAAAADLLWSHHEGFNLPYARRFKEALGIPVICVGGFQTREAMERPLREGACDAVSCARAMIANPLLWQHLRQGRTDVPRCSFCNACIGCAGALPVDCYDPLVRRARDLMLEAERAAA